MNAPLKNKPRKAEFSWQDPLLLDSQLSEQERMVRDAARDYAQGKLAPRVLEAFRNGFQRDFQRNRGGVRPGLSVEQRGHPLERRRQDFRREFLGADSQRGD